MDKKRLFLNKKILTPAGCLIIIACGIIGMTQLSSAAKHKAPPKPSPRKLHVETIPAETRPITLTAMAYGQAEPVTTVALSPQVSGEITQIHPALDAGGQVEKDALLFEVDPTDYALALEKARIQVALEESQVSQLQISMARDKERLPVIQQNTKLARREYLRLKALYEKSQVGTLTAVESAENAYNTLMDAEKTLEKTIALYPLEIAEARAGLADARADEKTARTNLTRCRVKAPFSGRIKAADMELGTYVSPGSTSVTLADDRELEIQIPLSDAEAFETLSFSTNGQGRFSDLNRLDCHVSPVMDTPGNPRPARVDRVVKYDADSRTLYLAVRVRVAAGTEGQIPLMDGMFCRVELAGKTIANAVQIPAKALNTDNTVYLARNQRIKTLAVNRVQERNNRIFITGDFQPGDRIVTSAPANVLENTPVEMAATLPVGTKGAQS
ncbi:MAG: efflux RND transporter periplasmic adaptor subunit [Desulfobacterales bacterium]|nr:efflux RND transporter periplasmic adaptor subunit [Desulfobacterales bacterium]